MKVHIEDGNSVVEVIIKCPEVTDDIRKIEFLLHSHSKKLPVTKDGATHLIDRHDVFYFESVDKRSFVYTADDVYESPLRLYELEEAQSEAGFIRSSKAQILNIAKIKSLCPDFGGRLEVVMENDESLIVSRQYAKLLKERLGLK